MKGHFANPRVHNVRLGGQAVLVGAGRFRPAEPLILERLNVNASSSVVFVLTSTPWIAPIGRNCKLQFHASLQRLELDAITRSQKASAKIIENRGAGG